MRKPLAPTAGKEQNPTASTMPVSNNINNNFAVRSKRAQTFCEYDSSGSNRYSKRVRLQADMLSKQSPEKPTCHECKKKTKADRLVNCIGQCSNKIHRSCLPPQFGKKTKEQFFECSDCQTCSFCNKEFPDATKLLKCYLCFVCYHSGCYQLDSDQSIRIVKEKRFSCSSCQRVQVSSTPKTTTRVGRNRVGMPILHTVTEASDLETSDVGEFFGFSATDAPLVPIHRSKSLDRTASMRTESHSDRNTIDIASMASRDHNNIIDDQRKLPNVIKWTHDEIYEYFNILFPLQAHVFHDEEIDGVALYQLKREDVLCGFKLKIGPAIKIYEHILKMQTERGV